MYLWRTLDTHWRLSNIFHWGYIYLREPIKNVYVYHVHTLPILNIIELIECLNCIQYSVNFYNPKISIVGNTKLITLWLPSTHHDKGRVIGAWLLSCELLTTTDLLNIRFRPCLLLNFKEMDWSIFFKSVCWLIYMFPMFVAIEIVSSGLALFGTRTRL